MIHNKLTEISPNTFDTERNLCTYLNSHKTFLTDTVYHVHGHVMRRDDTHVTKRVMGRPKKRWMDCVTNDMLEKGLDDAMTANRGEWIVEEDGVMMPTPNKMA